jgi:uncharacterized membrane protein
VADTFGKDFRRFFLRGLAAVLPTILTIAVIVWVLQRTNDYVAKYINIALAWLYAAVKVWVQGSGEQPYLEAVRKTYGDIWYNVWSGKLWWVGFVVAIIGVYILGRFVASFVGRKLLQLIDRWFFRLPVLKAVYPSIKQVTDFLLSEKKLEFSRVVAVEYPRRGMYSVAFVTGAGLSTITDTNGGEWLTVFVPTSPTPVTGYTLIVRRTEVIDLPLSVDDALRFTISGGVIAPAAEALRPEQIEQIRRGVLPSTEEKEAVR